MMGEDTAGVRIRFRVRYAETDQMGRAHHMQYLAWFELGRTELLRGTGVAYSELEKQGTLLPVSDAAVEYRRGVGYDELVEIETSVAEVRSRTVTFSYRALRASDGEVLATGSTRLVCTGSDGRPRRIPETVADTLRRLLAEATTGESSE
jgi:acyl-CoA thioester hydrolase